MLKFFNSFKEEEPFALLIKDRYIQAMQLVMKKDLIKVRSFAHIDLPNGIINNGEIANSTELAKSIKALLKKGKPRGIKGRNCVSAIPESQVYEHIFYLSPQLQGQQLASTISGLVQEVFPFELNEIVYDYHSHILNNVRIVSVVAVNKKILEQYKQVLQEQCDITPLYMEPESLSLLRNIKHDFQKDQGEFFVDIDSTNIGWYLIWNEQIFDSNSMLTPKRIGELKETLVHDIKKSLKYFNEHSKRDVVHIILSGEEQLKESLKKILPKEINKIPVIFLENYRVTQFMPEKTQYQMKIIGGLALKSIGIDIKNHINLLK